MNTLEPVEDVLGSSSSSSSSNSQVMHSCMYIAHHTVPLMCYYVRRSTSFIAFKAVGSAGNTIFFILSRIAASTLTHYN